MGLEQRRRGFLAAQDFFFSIARGDVPKHFHVNKYGKREAIGATEEIINDLGGVYTYSTTNNIDTVSSSSAADTQSVIFEGLYEDASGDWVEKTQTIVLTGQTPVLLPQGLIRIFRAYNDDNTDFVGDIYASINGATIVAGIPTIATEIRLKIVIGRNQTLMAQYTVPSMSRNNKRISFGYLVFGKASTSSGKDLDLTFYIRLKDKVFRVAHNADMFSANYDYFFIVPLPIPAQSDLEVRAVSSAAGTHVSAAFDIILIED